jgi:phospholipase/carboxylesterase
MYPTEQSARSRKQEFPSRTFSIESALFKRAAKDSSRTLFTPLHYEANYAYPLLVWLHAEGDDESQLQRIMPLLSLRNYAAVAPRGFPREQGGFAWPQTPDHIQEAEHRVFDGIEAAAAELHVSLDRIFLAGYGSGGTMALRLAMNHPARFAGVLSICGGLPSDHQPFSQLNQARRLPVLLAVGHESRAYSPAMACDNLRLLHTAGISVMLRLYPCSQELIPRMLGDVDCWVMEQITAPRED